MKKWLAIFLGLLALALLCFFCIKHHSSDIQNDISERSSATLLETGLPWASLNVEGRDVTLSGIAPSPVAKIQAQRIVEGIAGVRWVNNQITIGESHPQAVAISKAATKPYSTTINYTGNRVLLSGAAPDMNAANRLATAVRQRLSASVSNRLTTQPGAPENWLAVSSALLPQMKRFTSAQANISDTAIAFAGTLPPGANASAAQAAINAALPNSHSAAYALQATPAPIEKACPPIPPQKACPAVVAPQPCPAIDPCPACPATNDCSLVSSTDSSINSLPFAVTEPSAILYDALPSVDVASYQNCQNQFNSLLSGGSDVLFRISKAEITQRGRSVLRSIAEASADCPQANFQIAGHTDSRGGSSMNLNLSEQRANAVRNILVEFGIDDYRLSAVGYGESSPIASNETIAGRQANRRVEIIVEGL